MKTSKPEPNAKLKLKVKAWLTPRPLNVIFEHENEGGRCWLRFELGDGRVVRVPASIER